MSKLNKIPNMLSSEHIEILQVCTLFNLVIWFKIENEILNNMQICILNVTCIPKIGNIGNFYFVNVYKLNYSVKKIENMIIL